RGSRASNRGAGSDRRRARTSPGVLREVQDALGDDVPLHLGGARVDRARARPEELARPVDVVTCLGVGAQELAGRTEQIERRLAEALVELAPVELLERRLGARRAPVGQVGERADAVGAHDLVLDEQPPELLAHRGPRTPELPAGGREPREIASIAGGVGERPDAALVAEDGHGDAPPLADLTDQVLARHARVLEEDLAELALAGDLAERAHADARRVELHEEEGDAAVAVLRVGAREDEDPVGRRAEGGPHLRAVQHEGVAVEPRRGLERGEVAARPRLAEALAPDLVAREHGRDEAAALRLAAVVDERGAEEPDAEDVENGWRVGARQLGLHDRLLDLGAAAAAPLLGPVHAEVAGLIELLLPGAAQLDQTRLGGVRVAQLLPPGTRHVGREPGAQLVPEAEVRGGELQVHRVVCRLPARALSTSVEAPRLRSRVPGGYEGRFRHGPHRAHVLPALRQLQPGAVLPGAGLSALPAEPRPRSPRDQPDPRYLPDHGLRVRGADRRAGGHGRAAVLLRARLRDADRRVRPLLARARLRGLRHLRVRRRDRHHAGERRARGVGRRRRAGGGGRAPDGGPLLARRDHRADVP